MKYASAVLKMELRITYAGNVRVLIVIVSYTSDVANMFIHLKIGKKYPQIRIEKGTFLTPTYVYYQNGTLVGKFIN